MRPSYTHTDILAASERVRWRLEDLLGGDHDRVRALLGFAEEEAKRIELFRRFQREFERGFGSPCGVIGPPQEIARAVLSHHSLGVALVILHIEWMTQRHFVESVRGDRELDAQFASLLRHHWLEEAQHARLDALMVAAIAASCTPDEIALGLEDYAKIGALLDAGLAQQAELDRESFERKSGRVLTAAQRESFRAVQHQALRWTFLGSGMTHPELLAVVERLAPGARERVEELARSFS